MATVFGTSGNDSISPTGVSAGVTGGVPGNGADYMSGWGGSHIIDGGGGKAVHALPGGGGGGGTGHFR